MPLCRLIAEAISLVASRMKRRKYVPSGVVVREVDQSDPVYASSPEGPRIVRSQAEMEALFGSPQQRTK